VIATSTKVELSAAVTKVTSKIDDAFFAREKVAAKTGEEALFDASSPKPTVVSAVRQAAQVEVDAALKATIDKTELLGAYLGARFTLSKADKPHLMKF